VIHDSTESLCFPDKLRKLLSIQNFVKRSKFPTRSSATKMLEMSLSLRLQPMVLSALFNQRRVPENHSIRFNGRGLPFLETGLRLDMTDLPGAVQYRRKIAEYCETEESDFSVIYVKFPQKRHTSEEMRETMKRAENLLWSLNLELKITIFCNAVFHIIQAIGMTDV
jgi:hypothetical protein